MQYGFTCAPKSDGIQYLQCLLCNVKLRNSSLAPAKLREHFTKVYGTGKYVGTTLNQFKQKGPDFVQVLPLHLMVPMDKAILTASYKVAYLIAKTA